MPVTSAQWEYFATLCRKARGMSKAVGLDGPNAEKMRALLTLAEQRAKGKVKEEGSEDDLVMVVEDESSNGHTREARPTPAGTFANRERKVTFAGKTFTANSIAHAICLIFKQLGIKVGGEGGEEIKAADIAKAIKAAYPENSYEEYRVYVDLKKYLKGVFTCQRRGEV